MSVVDVGDVDPPLADSPDVEDDLQSEVASLRRELARRDAELELNAGEDTDTIMQLAAKAALAGVSIQEIEKAMEGDNTRTILSGLIATNGVARCNNRIVMQRGTTRSDGPRRRRSSTGSHGVPSETSLAAMGQHRTAAPPVDSSPLPALFNHGLLHFTVDDGLAFELPLHH